MTTTFTNNGNDLSFASIGADIRRFGVTIGNWVHIVGVNGDGSWVYQGNRTDSSDDIPLLHFGSGDSRLFVNDRPYIAEGSGGTPVVASIGNDPRRLVHGNPQIESPYVMTRAGSDSDSSWVTLLDGETSIPHLVSDKLIPAIKRTSDVICISEELGSIVVRSVSSSSVSEISRIDDFSLVDAVPFGDDILVLAIWDNGGYPCQSLSADGFNGQTFTFWKNAPFLFVLRDSESFLYFNSFSSTNESPLPLVSMNSGTSNSMSTNGSDVYVTSVVQESGKWKQAVSYCTDGGEWDMMNGAIFPFDEFPSVSRGDVCDISYDGVSGDPIAMFLSGSDISIRFFDPSASGWRNWRGYDVANLSEAAIVPPPTSSSSSSSCSSSSSSCSSSSSNSSSCSSSSSSSSSSVSASFSLSSMSMSNSSNSFSSSSASSTSSSSSGTAAVPGGIIITVTGSPSTTDTRIRWCGEVWKLPADSGVSYTITPDFYGSGTGTKTSNGYEMTHKAWWQKGPVYVPTTAVTYYGTPAPWALPPGGASQLWSINLSRTVRAAIVNLGGPISLAPWSNRAQRDGWNWVGIEPVRRYLTPTSTVFSGITYTWTTWTFKRDFAGDLFIFTDDHRLTFAPGSPFVPWTSLQASWRPFLPAPAYPKAWKGLTFYGPAVYPTMGVLSTLAPDAPVTSDFSVNDPGFFGSYTIAGVTYTYQKAPGW